MFLLYTGCASSWSPTDDEAVKLVKRYYVFSREGTEVEAAIVERGVFTDECKCFPIKFEIVLPDKQSYKETFYFFKNESGELDMRKYKRGMNT